MDLQDPYYNPNGFIDWARKVMRAKNDRHLGVLLTVSPAVLSRIRSYKAPVTSQMLIAIHEHTGLRTLEIKTHMFFKPD